MRIAISAEERLAITLKFLATGDSYGTLSELFRISRPSIVEIVPEVCQAIFDALKEDYLQVSPIIKFHLSNPLIFHMYKDRWFFKLR